MKRTQFVRTTTKITIPFWDAIRLLLGWHVEVVIETPVSVDAEGMVVCGPSETVTRDVPPAWWARRPRQTFVASNDECAWQIQLVAADPKPTGIGGNSGKPVRAEDGNASGVCQ